MGELLRDAYSEEWYVSDSTEYTLYLFDQMGMYAWQWKFAITDPQVNTVQALSKEDCAITSGKVEPPKCQPVPGFNANGDTSYQECVKGYYLLGYSS